MKFRDFLCRAATECAAGGEHSPCRFQLQVVQVLRQPLVHRHKLGNVPARLAQLSGQVFGLIRNEHHLVLPHLQLSGRSEAVKVFNVLGHFRHHMDTVCIYSNPVGRARRAEATNCTGRGIFSVGRTPEQGGRIGFRTPAAPLAACGLSHAELSPAPRPFSHAPFEHTPASSGSHPECHCRSPGEPPHHRAASTPPAHPSDDQSPCAR